MKNILIFFVAILFILFFERCKHQPQEPLLKTDHSKDIKPNNDSICFNTHILPIILSNCALSGCHGSQNPADDIKLTSYNEIITIVKPNNADDSKLIKVITRTDSKRMPPPPANALENETILILKKWINQGAVNSICNFPCDTFNVKFSIHVQPILKKYCQGCHSGASPSAGISIENYNQTKIIVENGKLMGSIQHLSGYSAMPKGLPKMSLCNIRTIAKWIEGGYLNN